MVRFAEEKDIPRINELRRRVSELHAAGRPDIFKPGFPKELQDYAHTLLQREESDILAAERDGVICGIAAVEYQYKPETPYSYERRTYHVMEFGVDEAYRRQGVGRELMDFIAADAKAKGFSRIELDMWAFNESAQAFYEALGFHTYRLLMERNI